MLKFELKQNDKHFNKPICFSKKSCGFLVAQILYNTLPFIIIKLK